MPALLLLAEAWSFCLNCISYSVFFLLKLHQNSPYLLYPPPQKSLLNASSTALLILRCNLYSRYANKFAVPHLQSQASTLGMCPCSCKQGSVFWDAAVPPHSPHRLPISCLLRQHTCWLPVTLLTIMDPFFDILNLLAPTSFMCQSFFYTRLSPH